jgi:molybdopterin/thiamine biosynthesis adenylyltransferase
VFSLVLPEECARMLIFYDLSGHGARIWGQHGQSVLKCAHICVLNCGPTGSESLKNLVLGGIGSFTVVDASKVCASDLGNNYFGMLLFLLYDSSLA